MRPHLHRHTYHKPHMTYRHVPTPTPAAAADPWTLLHQSTLHDCLPSAEAKSRSTAFQSYEATWGIAPRCYCPTLPFCNHTFHIYTTQPRTPTETPTPPRPPLALTRLLSQPPSQPQQFDHRQIARLNDSRLQGLSCAAGYGQCREQTRRWVASIPERPDEMYDIPTSNNMRKGIR